MDDTHARPMRTFGRTRSRTIKPRQAGLLADRLPDLAAPAVPFDPRALAQGLGRAWLEIGFGGGEHLAAQARGHPGVLVLGAEPFVNGVASALRHVQDLGLTNVRLHAGDARDLMALMPNGCLERIFILFPDPWPKSRHHKRRLVQPAFVAEAARLLAPGGRLRFATDWADYADRALATFLASPDLRWLATRAADWRQPPADHAPTRYEFKALGDCAPVWLEFERR